MNVNAKMFLKSVIQGFHWGNNPFSESYMMLICYKWCQTQRHIRITCRIWRVFLFSSSAAASGVLDRFMSQHIPENCSQSDNTWSPSCGRGGLHSHVKNNQSNRTVITNKQLSHIVSLSFKAITFQFSLKVFTFTHFSKWYFLEKS